VKLRSSLLQQIIRRCPPAQQSRYWTFSAETAGATRSDLLAVGIPSF
jgi:hypothetical protein